MPPLTLLAGALLLSSCGGGGGNSLTTPTATPTATTNPSAVYVPSGCTATTYSPNYVLSNNNDGTFSYWRHFPISIYVQPTTAATANTPATFTAPASTLTAALNGFREWNSAVGAYDKWPASQSFFTITTNAATADIVLSFLADNKPANKDGLVTVGLTTLYASDPSQGGDNHIVSYGDPGYNSADHNTIQLFVLNPDGTPEGTNDTDGTTQSIAAHEFGHALGIGPHSTNPNDLMYLQLNNTPPTPETPTKRDVNTLLSAYCNTFPFGSSSALERKGAAAKSDGTARARISPPFRRHNK